VTKKEVKPFQLLCRAPREQHVPRERATRGYANQDSRVAYSNDLPAVIRHFWNARLLRAPPLSSIKESGRFASDNVAALPSCFPAAILFNGTARLESEILTRPGDALQVALVFEFDLRLGA